MGCLKSILCLLLKRGSIQSLPKDLKVCFEASGRDVWHEWRFLLRNSGLVGREIESALQ